MGKTFQEATIGENMQQHNINMDLTEMGCEDRKGTGMAGKWLHYAKWHILILLALSCQVLIPESYFDVGDA
jgi:hypothetical protein